MDLKNSLPSSKYLDFVKKNQKNYNWLYCKDGETDSQEDQDVGLYCSLCQEYVQKTMMCLTANQKTFIEKPSTCTKSNASRDHGQSLIHSNAFKWKYRPVSEDQATLLNFDKERIDIQNDDIMTHFLSAYFLSKEDVALYI